MVKASVGKPKTKAQGKMSKKKQKQMAKSAKVMIDKMDAHTTADDIFNIVKSVENGRDTKEVGDGNDNSAVEGLRGLKTIKEDIKKDLVTKEKNEIKKAKDKAELEEQMKLIESFNL